MLFCLYKEGAQFECRPDTFRDSIQSLCSIFWTAPQICKLQLLSALFQLYYLLSSNDWLYMVWITNIVKSITDNNNKDPVTQNILFLRGLRQ